ncbi:hypothetical protein D3C81_685490 [compost metagenome]
MRLAPLVVDEAVALVLVGDDAPADPAIVGQRAASVQLQAIVVPGAGLAGEGDGGSGLAAFAHQVDRTARAAGALQQAGSAAQDFHTVEEHQVLGRPVAQRIVVARDRHTVVLPVVDLETARGHHHARADALGADDPGGVVERLLQVGDALVIQLLAGDHRHRLRGFLEGMRAFAEGDRTGGIRAAAFAGGIQVVVGNAGAAQLQHIARLAGRGHAEVAAAGDPQLQAAAGQGGLHGLLGAHLADHGGRLLAAYQCGFQGDDGAALAGNAVEGACQARRW